MPFYHHLKIVKAYQALVQDVNNHPVLIIMPTRYIETVRYFTNNSNIGQPLNHIVSDLSQKSSLTFIFALSTKVILIFLYLFDILYNLTLLVLVTQKMDYGLNFYKNFPNISRQVKWWNEFKTKLCSKENVELFSRQKQ